MALTKRKRLYAEARLSGLTKKQSAIEAGCPEKTASQAASRYEKDPDVIAHIERKGVIVEAKEKGEKLDLNTLSAQHKDPKEFLAAVMNDTTEDMKIRMDAAKTLMPYEHSRPGEKGKKEERQEKAEKVAGRFSGLRSVK